MKLKMYLYIAIIFIVILILYMVLQNIQVEHYLEYDWSDKWSDLDKKARINANCKPIYKLQRKIGEVSSWVWVVPKSCEQGLPHTRAVDVIAIPENMMNNNKISLASVMEHEKVHLLQRQMPWQWARFYRIAWNYEIYTEPPINMPNELIAMRRANPDTALAPYACWKNNWWSVPVYNSKDDLSLKDASVKWWDQQTNTINLHPPDDWIQFFGFMHQDEHPHELSAEYLASKEQEEIPAKRILLNSMKLNAEFPEI